MPAIELREIHTVPLAVANKWCSAKYPGHPKGCPNNKRCRKSKSKKYNIEDFIDLKRRMYVIWVEFDLKAHAEKMQELHSDWTVRQCRNLIYWQPKARKQLSEEINKQLSSGLVEDTGNYLMVAEGFGIHVMKTLHRNGLKLEGFKRPNIVRKLVLVLPVNSRRFSNLLI